MAPIPSDEESESAGSIVNEQGRQNNSTGTSAAILQTGEEEFHTEESDGSEGGLELVAEYGASDAEDVAAHASGIPLLPESLLKHIPQSAPAVQSLADVPWEQLIPKQKKSRRHNNQKMKKREYERLRAEAEGTGVLEAGRVAQAKRGIVPVKKERVRSGRVEKKSKAKVKMSGRQQMIEQRKRDVQMSGSGVGGRVTRAKSKTNNS